MTEKLQISKLTQARSVYALLSPPRLAVQNQVAGKRQARAWPLGAATGSEPCAHGGHLKACSPPGTRLSLRIPPQPAFRLLLRSRSDHYSVHMKHVEIIKTLRKVASALGSLWGVASGVGRGHERGTKKKESCWWYRVQGPGGLGGVCPQRCRKTGRKFEAERGVGWGAAPRGGTQEESLVIVGTDKVSRCRIRRSR